MNFNGTCDELGEPILRPLERPDLDGLVRFGSRLSDRSRKYFSPHPWSAPDGGRAAIARSIEEDRSTLRHVLVQNGEIVGYLVMAHRHCPDGPAAFMISLGIIDRCQGARLGGLLVGSAKRIARSRQAGALLLSVDGENIAALRLYRREGFRFERVVRIRDWSVDGTEGWRNQQEMLLRLIPAGFADADGCPLLRALSRRARQFAMRP